MKTNFVSDKLQFGFAQCGFALLMLAFGSMAAQAQATRTWVSGVGDDVNPCSRTAPCKTFAGAISKTAAGGEISVLDPGGFGAVTITKAITINGTGALAGILNAGTNGIVINAGVNDKIIIRNISIVGAGSGLDGIRFLNGLQLTVENVTIDGMTGDGIEVALPNGGHVFVTDTNITKCNGDGIKVATTAGTVTAHLDNVRVERVTNGVNAASTNSIVNLIRSSLIDNTGAGALASGNFAIINIEKSAIAFNNEGVNASATQSNIRIADNGIYNNGTGVKFVGGAVSSDGNNRIGGNGSSQTPNAAIVKQ